MTSRSRSLERTIRISLTCEAPPTAAGIEFGLQDRSGALIGGVREPDGSLRFQDEIAAVTIDDGKVALRGRIVHGAPDARFLYLSCRAANDPDGRWIFRLKVPLAGIPTDADSVEGRVRASGGGSVALLGRGWTAYLEPRDQPANPGNKNPAPPSTVVERQRSRHRGRVCKGDRAAHGADRVYGEVTEGPTRDRRL